MVEYIIHKLITAYQKLISPVLGSHCRFYPSCSIYCQEAIVHFGLLQGLKKGLLRVLRCHPFSAGGYDPAVK